MSETRPDLSLGETIEFLRLYLDWLGHNARMPPDEHMRQFQVLLGSCHGYLSVYRDSLQSMVRIKEQLESLKLRHEATPFRPQ